MQPSKLRIITATILFDDGSDGTNGDYFYSHYDPDAIAAMLLLKIIMIVMIMLMLMLFVDTYHEGASRGGSYPWSGEGSVAQ
jgi:hypothetical protein